MRRRLSPRFSISSQHARVNPLKEGRGARRWWVPIVTTAIGLSLYLGGTFQADHRSRIRQARALVHDAHRSLAQFTIDYDRCPRTLTELAHPPGRPQGYVFSGMGDPWGTPLEILCPDTKDALDHVAVTSAGPSGDFLEDDNIVFR